MRQSNLFWGVLLILAGVIFLLDNLGILRVNVWSLIWPFFLIILGFWILFGVLLRSGAGRAEQVSIPLDAAARARVHVHHGAGRLHVDAGAGAGELLAGSFSGGLDYQARREGDVLDVEMRMRDTGAAMWMPFAWGPGGTVDWSFGLNPELPLALWFETGASETMLDLSNLRVNELRLKTGASSTQINLPANAGQTRVAIEAGAASVHVRVPGGIAASIRAQTGLAGLEIDTERFPRRGDIYQSPDYGTAANQVEIRVEAGVGSISIH